MKFQFFLFLCTTVYVGNAVPSCCQNKRVNNINYYLAEPHMNDNPAQFGCKDDCVYEAMEPIDGRFCFKKGRFPAKCLDTDCPFDWDYNEKGKYGPQNWGKYCPACGGKHQSPIDIVTTGMMDTKDTPLPPLTFSAYEKIRADQMVVSNSEEHYGMGVKGTRLHTGEFRNNGHTAQLDVNVTGTDFGILSGGPLGDEYQILQLHFHWGPDNKTGSEHTLDGLRYPMEMHIVHRNMRLNDNEFLSKPRGLAVTGFFFNVANENNAAIEPLVFKLQEIKSPFTEQNMTGSDFKISDLICDVLEKSKYSSYSGSLTTPPCTENVIWINFLDPIPISSTQLKQFRMLKDMHEENIEHNFRPVQPLHGREVKFYDQGTCI